jgi:HlyD family secretion protein
VAQGSSMTAERLQIPDLNRRVRTQRVVWAVVLIAAALIAAFVFSQREQQVVEPYRTVKLARRDVVRVVEASGRVDARSRFEVPAPFAGRLTEILVKAGARVRRGQPMARLDDREGVFAVQNADAAQQAASAHKSEAQSALESAQAELKRVQRLAARGLASEQELAGAQSVQARTKASLEAARAQQGAAAAQLASARFTRGLGEIIAPIEGVVLTGPENLGSAVTPERPLFVLAEPLEKMRVDVDVAEADIGLVRVGQKAQFEVLTFPGRSFDAQVERLAVEPRRDGGVVTYAVRLLAENADLTLLPGMSATVRLEVARVNQALTVRDAALRFTPPGVDTAAPRSRVFLHVGVGQLSEVPVKAGLSDGTYTEIAPDAAGKLVEGADVAVGVLRADVADRGGPGISLGGR